jgi:hypothetical protein
LGDCDQRRRIHLDNLDEAEEAQRDSDDDQSPVR